MIARTSNWLLGLLAALVCGFSYYGFGTQWTLKPRPSLYVHPILTANAWLHGRTYVTAGEIERQFMLNALLRAGWQIGEQWDERQLRDAFEKNHAAYLRSLGVPEKHIPDEVSAYLKKAYLDWVRIDDRYYAYWPPVPSALMVPIVAVLGTDFSDVVVANVLGAMTVLMVFFMLLQVREIWPALGVPACLVLALFYGLGTCHMYQASAGQVWLISQLTATLFLIIAINFALTDVGDGRGPAPNIGRWMAASAALALGFLSRNTIVGAAPFFFVVLWKRARSAPAPARSFTRTSAIFLAALLLGVAAQLAFNHVRFGNAFDLGQGRLAEEGGDPSLSADFMKVGRFDTQYIPRNLWYCFLNPKLREFPAYDPAQAGLTFDPQGNSLFLVSPLFVYAFVSWRRGPRWIAISALAGALPGLIALMLYYNTGWYQFGQRYLLDVMPFLLLLTAFGMRGRVTRVSAALIGLSILINAWGTHRFILEQG